jgi:hypothetical protein
MKKLIFLPLILIATACSATVEEKFHVPEFERTHEECFESNRYGCVEGKDLVVKIPECWRIITYDGFNREEFCVDQETWKNTYIGQEWN